MSVSIHKSVQLVWAIANTEANLACDTQIRPVHFFLAILKVVDSRFLKQLEGVNLSEEDTAEIACQSREVRHYLEMSGEEVTKHRRSIRQEIRHGKEKGSEIRMLHRSEETRTVFNAAIARTAEVGGPGLSLLNLTESLFSTGYVTLDPSKGNPPKQNPGSTGARWEMVSDGREKKQGRYVQWFGRNLSRMSSEGNLQPFVGRAAEIRLIMAALSRTTKRHVAILGHAGVGKTALVEGLAAALNTKQAPEALNACQVLELRASDIASDCQTEAELNRRINHLFGFLMRHPGSIFFLDDFKALFPKHLKPDSTQALLTSLLADGHTLCIIASTPEKWKTLIAEAPSLARQFQLVKLIDPTKAQCREMAQMWVNRLSHLHNVTFSPAAIDTVVEVAHGLPADRAMPDNIVDLLQNVATYVTVATLSSGVARREILPRDVECVLLEHYGVGQERAPRPVSKT